jgi:hypothetical protein
MLTEASLIQSIWPWTIAGFPLPLSCHKHANSSSSTPFYARLFSGENLYATRTLDNYQRQFENIKERPGYKAAINSLGLAGERVQCWFSETPL